MDEKNEKLQEQTLPQVQDADEILPQVSQETLETLQEELGEAPAGSAPAAAGVSQETLVFTPLDIPSVKNDTGKTFAPIQTQVPPTATRSAEGSRFDGSPWEYLGWWCLGALLTLVTLGVGLSWAQCMFWRWRAKHTIISGRRMTFDGTGIQLFEKYLLWGICTVFTLGIYGLWLPVKVRQWYCSHLFLSGLRRPAQPKVPVWRTVLSAIAAVLVFALILTGIILAATDRLPWQGDKGPGPNEPGETTTSPQETPGSTPESTPEATPEATPAPSTTPVPDPTTPPPAPTTTPAPDPTTAPLDTYTVTAASGLNLRTEPNTQSRALVLMPKGTQVQPEAWSGGWAKVTYDGHTGWCSGDYLAKNAG